MYPSSPVSRMSLVVLLLCLAACGQQQDDVMAADLVLLNAQVVTMDAADSIGQAVAISDNKINSTIGDSLLIYPADHGLTGDK